MYLTIGFSKPKNWKLFAEIIKFGYQIPYSHTYIKFWSDKYQRFLIYQASHSYVNFMNVQIFEKNNIIVKEFNLNISEEARTKIIQFSIDNVGKRYGILSAIGLGLVRLCEVFNIKIDNPFSDDLKTLICSELVAFILKEYNIIQINENINNINPKQLYNLINTIEK